MNTLRHTSVIIRQLTVAALYFIVAIVALNFAVVEGNATILWPSSGVALAVLIRFGMRYAIGVFFGAFVAGVYVGNPHYVSALIALGNTLEPLLATYLLRLLPFTPSLYRLHDYLSLVLAGSVGAIASALLGTLALILAGFIPLSLFFSIAGSWWMGDALGVLLIAPFLLMVSLHSYKKVVESLLLLAFTTIVSFLVMTDWNDDLINTLGGTYILIIPLTWSVLRFGQSMTSTIIFQYFAIGIWGLLNQQGLFVNNNLEPNLNFFWLYFVVITLVSHAVSYAVSERNTLFQAINSSKTETYVFCEGKMTFEFVNQAALDNLGLSLSQALKLTFMDIKPLLTKKEFDDLMMPLIKKQVEVINFETVQQRADGSMYPVEVTLQSVKHANRDCYLASIVDITERIERDQHRILGNHVCDLSSQAVMITDRDNLIVRVNSVFTEITGYTPEEVLGKKPYMLSSGRHDKAFYSMLWESLNTHGSWEGEVYNRRKDGVLYLQHLSIKLLHDARGHIQNYIAMFRDITNERNQSIELQHISEHDVLTGLPNRMKLQREFEFALTAAKRHRNKLAVLFLDLNDFKPINDTYGHMCGDDVLQTIADRMSSSVRDSDMVARIGGDEFVVLMTDVDSDDAIQTLATKLKKIIAEPIIVEENTFTISASLGVAEYPKHGDTLETLLKLSDSEMYKNKAEMKKKKP
ncbi:MAG: diguanylate cyclase [Piscirickettsiaceae bacterium]|nr:diguanylate cyclase [Piscirickettsiaceae bacterium]